MAEVAVRVARKRGTGVLAAFLAACLAAVVVAGCAAIPAVRTTAGGATAGGAAAGGATAGGNVPAFDARARQVAAAWQHSPLARAWRTGLVLLSTRNLTSIPPGQGFATAALKSAFTDGAYTLDGELPAGRPAGRVTWAGGGSLTVPVLTARQALAKIAVNKPCAAGPCGKLTVTGARTATVTLATSRGQATVPAWSFTVRELPFPVTRVALAPGSYDTLSPVLPSQPGQGFDGVSAAKASADGQTVTLWFTTGACVTRWGGLAYPAGPVVVLGSWSYAPDDGSACPAMLMTRTATVRLAAPLGSRALLDVGTGHPVAAGPA